jgi:hypothetical protein
MVRQLERRDADLARQCRRAILIPARLASPMLLRDGNGDYSGVQ